MWDVETGNCFYVLEGHSSTVRCMAMIGNTGTCTYYTIYKNEIVADIGMKKGQKQDWEYWLYPFLYFHNNFVTTGIGEANIVEYRNG